MAHTQPSNVAASVRQRLLNQARARGDDFQALLTRYVLERFLYRLSQSPHSERFVVKGAMLFLVWEGELHRTTRDLDLLMFGPSDVERMKAYMHEILEVAVQEEDGIVFHPETIRSALIREDRIHEGVRVSIESHLGSARIPLQIDIGFGDAVTPAPEQARFPVLLSSPVPLLRVYPRETVIAEKFQAMVELGIANSRMKDFYDIWFLARGFRFEGEWLCQAIEATFSRRNTDLPADTPVALTPAFAEDPGKQRQWDAFLRKTRIGEEAPVLPDVTERLRSFLMPPTIALVEDRPRAMHWLPGGPWQSSEG